MTKRPVDRTQAQTAQVPTQGLELAIIVPTFNEHDNIAELVRRIASCLGDVAWEIIVVDDDSPDGTAQLVRRIGMQDRRVRCLQRLGRRGLSSACIEGMLSTAAPYLAVIDGDLQHDEMLLPQMLDTLRNSDDDIVIGSRYVAGGGVGDWDSARTTISRLATRLSHLVLRADLTDPMSGFFMMRREAFHAAVRHLSGIGFKILVDIFASSPQPLRYKELPYQFRIRQAGESKLDSQVAWEYVMLLVDKTVGHLIPVRFVAFTLVGGFGVGVHLLTLSMLYKGFAVDFLTSQASATLVSMTGNYALNNVLTYRDRRLRGWRWLRGWASFSLACGIGALANIGIASYLFTLDTLWLFSALAGIAVSAVWNYAVTAAYTWARPKPG